MLAPKLEGAVKASLMGGNRMSVGSKVAVFFAPDTKQARCQGVSFLEDWRAIKGDLKALGRARDPWRLFASCWGSSA